MDLQEYKKAIEENFSGFSVQKIEKIGQGWDNFAFLVNNEYIFRFPQDNREYVIKQLQSEISLLPKLQKRFDLLIPNFEFIGKHQGLPFVGYKKIDGIPFTPNLFRTLSKDAKTQAIKDLAAFITKLHEFPADEARKCIAWEETSKEIYQNRLSRVKDLEGKVPKHLLDYLRSQFDIFFSQLVDFEQESVLVHADLTPDHILFNRQTQKIEGIIDFGDIAISDPDMDLRWMLDPDDFDPEFLDEFLKYYKHPNPEMLKKRLRFFWNVSSMIDLFHGIDNDDPEKFAVGIKYLQRNAQS